MYLVTTSLRVCLFALFYLFSATQVVADEKLLHISDFSYEGAFRIPGDRYGDSKLGFANGNFTLSPDKKSIFIVGQAGNSAIAQYLIPDTIVKSDVLTELSMAELPKQEFVKVIPKATTGNEQELSNVTGLNFFNDKLIVNLAKFYDASGSVTHTTLNINDPLNLRESTATGFYTIEGRARAAGWFSEIPAPYVNEFGGPVIVGHAANLSINGRFSMGPSAYIVDDADLIAAGANDVVNTLKLIDYPLYQPLHDDLYNKEGNNELWTEISKAHYGFIVPGTRTYLVVGSSGGHESGIGYKITQDNGRLCPGACPREAADFYSFVWMYKVDDLLKVKKGQLQPHEPRPYYAGKLNVPFQPDDVTKKRKVVVGGDYDMESGKLYLLLGDADTLQSRYENKPLMVVYSFKTASKPAGVGNVEIQITP